MSTGFRIALAAYTMTVIAVVVVVLLIGPVEMPAPAMEYLVWWSSQPQSKLEFVAGWVGLFATLFSLLSATALFFYGSWSRPLFAVSVFIIFVCDGLMEYPVLRSSFEAQMESLASLLAGGIIAMSYWSPLAAKFIGSKTTITSGSTGRS